MGGEASISGGGGEREGEGRRTLFLVVALVVALVVEFLVVEVLVGVAMADLVGLVRALLIAGARAGRAGSDGGAERLRDARGALGLDAASILRASKRSWLLRDAMVDD